MTDAIAAFFGAWSQTDDAARKQAIAKAFASQGTYADPRTPERLSGVDAIAGYVAMFSANAPGWTAKVVAQDESAGVIRVTVAFGGTGPDGSHMQQLGQYFAEVTDGQITRMTGFVGTGAPE